MDFKIIKKYVLLSVIILGLTKPTLSYAENFDDDFDDDEEITIIDEKIPAGGLSNDESSNIEDENIPMGNIFEDLNNDIIAKFEDIKNHWSKNYIEFVVNRGLFKGTSDTTFSPNSSMTKGMLVTVLGRMANINVEKYSSSKFKDVDKNKYYSKYIQWADENDIIRHNKANTFSPDKNITREEVVSMMYNYSKMAKQKLPKKFAINKFNDDDLISSYAKDAVKAMQSTGVINGRNGNLFDPKANITRGEVAKVLTTYMKIVK